jgi:hypothetical protein
MKRTLMHSQYVATLFLTIFSISSSASQGSHGIELAAGVVENFGFSFSAAYFHPLPLQQFYAIGGVSFCSAHGSSNVVPADWGNVLRTTNPPAIQRLFLGVQVGDYLFAIPKLSLNSYGKQTSIGWGLDGGLMLHPSRFIAFGFKFTYDQFRLVGNGSGYWPHEVNTMALLFRIKFDH